MNPKLPDIKNRNDIEILVNSFYEDVKKDKKIARFFVHINWDVHLPIMYTFWENVLFYTGNYVGNPMVLHQKLHERMPLSEFDFAHWISLFTQTIDKMYVGPMASSMKERANNIAIIMQVKILP